MYKLLIIDDEKKILEGISEIFPWNNVGFEVLGQFTRAKSALLFLETEKADVVLTDISMPDMTGIELAKELKKYPDLLVVLFSSFSDYSYMREAVKLEIEDYLLKPVNYSELSTCFEKIKIKLDAMNAVEEEQDTTYYGNIIKVVDDYLEQNFQTGTLADAAELVGFSPGYLSRIYKETKGVGFGETLNGIRMKKAAEMLMDPSCKGYEIAFRVGYDNPKNFARAFKGYWKVTPREYRSGVRNQEGGDSDI